LVRHHKPIVVRLDDEHNHMDHSENLLQQECFMTRPISRIHRILEKLETVWLEQPDQRLCQRIANLAREYPAWPDLFSYEDDELEKALDKAIEEEMQEKPDGEGA
jgi:hypothetical protein